MNSLIFCRPATRFDLSTLQMNTISIQIQLLVFLHAVTSNVLSQAVNSFFSFQNTLTSNKKWKQNKKKRKKINKMKCQNERVKLRIEHLLRNVSVRARAIFAT